MAFRIGDLVLGGFICHSPPFCVHGQLALRGMEFPLVIELTGNPAEELRGRNFEFEIAENDIAVSDEDRARVQKLRDRQVGALARMAIVRNAGADDAGPADESLEELAPPWCDCLCLEWFGQNGRIVIELWDPELEYFEREEPKKLSKADLEEGKNGAESEGAPANPEDEAETTNPFPGVGPDVSPNPADEEAEGYGLTPHKLDEELEKSAQATDREIARGSDDGSDVIAECELLDELIDSHAPGTPVTELLAKLSLPSPEANLTEVEAERALTAALAELALYGVAFHICEHYTIQEAYRALMTHVAPECTVHLEIRGTGWCTHFMTSDFCPKCLGEWDGEDPPF